MRGPRFQEPFFWALFSSGGMASALLLPALAFLLWIAGPLGWVDLRPAGDLAPFVRNPLVRAGIALVATLCLFHWAHRFRYTLYDGLQLKHLNALIAAICYGGAAAGSLAAAIALFAP